MTVIIAHADDGGDDDDDGGGGGGGLGLQFPPGLSAFAKASADRSGQPGGNIG
ncbi:MAG: hypothetical protein ABR955_15135 [Verrucomicrobiota bacterium]